MRKVSKKRGEWLAEYKKARESFEPRECARCGLKGNGWTHNGGDFEAHHPFRRTTRAFTLCFVSLCPPCHQWVEDHATEARRQGWISNPKRSTFFT